jgi:hypothetical protein
MLAEIGSLDLSAAALLQAREGYIERALAQEVLAVSRDLVSLYKRQEDWLRLEQMLLSTREVLSRGRLESEMLSSLRDFEQTPSLKT